MRAAFARPVSKAGRLSLPFVAPGESCVTHAPSALHRGRWLYAGCFRISLACSVEQPFRPEVAAQGDDGAPDERDPRVVPDRLVRQQAAQGLDDRRERLVLGEPAQPGRQGVGRDKPTTKERQEYQWHGQVARRLDALAQLAERDAEP